MTPADNAAAVDAAHVLREKIDVLLDRLTDTVLRSPTPGTAQWRNLVHSAGDLTRMTRGDRRADVRALIAAHAGVTDPAVTDPAVAPQHSPTSPGAASRRHRGLRPDPAQLTIF
jgi:hypothetical protein